MVFTELLPFVEIAPRNREKTKPFAAFGDRCGAGNLDPRSGRRRVCLDDDECCSSFFLRHGSYLKATHAHSLQLARQPMAVTFIRIYLRAHEGHRVIEPIKKEMQVPA